MDILKHPALAIFQRIRLRQCRGHRDSPCGTWPGLVKESRVACLQVSEESVERLFEVLQRPAANHARSVHIAELSYVNVGAAELCVDQRDHFIKNRTPLRFSEEGHLSSPPCVAVPGGATTADASP